MSLTAFAIVCLVALINARPAKADTWPFVLQPTQLTTTPITGELEGNLKTTAQFNLTHTAAIQICFNEEYDVPKNTSTWAASCSFHFTFPAGTSFSVGSVPLRFSDYTFGIYFDGVTTPGQSDVISLVVGQGVEDSCPNDDNVWNGTDCVPVTKMVIGNTVQNFTGNETAIFSFKVPKAPTVTGSFKISGPADFIFVVRREGAPTNAQGLFDVQGKGLVQFNFPRPGTYYVSVYTPTSQNDTTVSLSLEDCSGSPLHGSGPGCSTSWSHAISKEDLTGAPGALWKNYIVFASKKNPLYVAVASNDGSPNPTIYASQGQVPEPGNADITGCNTDTCGFATVISRIPSDNETWYVAVGSQDGQSYAVWFSTICAPTCVDAGTCTQNGPDAGKCVCTSDVATGAGCQISNAIGQQYIVLAAIWGTAAGLTVVVFLAYYLSTGKDTYERVA